KPMSAVGASSRKRWGANSSTLHVANRGEPHYRLADTCRVCCSDDGIDVLVSAASFFGQTGVGNATDIDATRRQVALELLAAEEFLGLLPAHAASATVRRSEERLRAGSHAAQQVRTAFHAAADDDRLTAVAKCNRHVRHPRSEGAG